MNMKNWIAELISAEKKKALPVLSFPSISLLDISVRDITSNSDYQAQGMKAIANRCCTAAAVSMMDLSVEAEAFGSEICYVGDEVPTVIGSIVVEPEDAVNLRVPEVGEGRTGLYIEAIAKAVQLITDRPVFAGVIGPYSLAGRIIGMSEIMLNCFDEPEMVHTVLRKATDFIIRYILAYKQVGANGVVVAEPAVGLLSAGMANEFATPYMTEIVDAVQNDSFALICHNCGNSTAAMIDELTAIRAAGYHFGDAVDMLAFCEALPSDRLIMGNISPAKTFLAGSPEQMRCETTELLNKCGKYPNFIISSGCDIPPAASWENIDAFFSAVDEFYDK